MSSFSDRLVLFQFISGLFGQEDFSGFSEIKNFTGDEINLGDNGQSTIVPLLESWVEADRVASRLKQYDQHILAYVERLNTGRDGITLKYFQYLSVLFSEIYLDYYFNERELLLTKLNDFVAKKNQSTREPFSPFRKKDLQKLAYWMATGSGKTLLMHINYWQFLHYKDVDLDNIILITPNEGLSHQHLQEMNMSGIACSHVADVDTGFTFNPEQIQVIEIHKLAEESKEKTISVDSFEGNNLVFVDEGHKGSGSGNGNSDFGWMDRREAVIGKGFVFEYSATYGQALSESDNKPLLAEYEKSILFDYSYKNFYKDGYGKDYRILNLRESPSQEFTDRLLLANLISFYQQLHYWEENQDQLEEYNLEKPLWIFVGGKVNAVYTEHGEKTSDVLTIIRFLNRFLENNEEQIQQEIERILSGDGGLVDQDGSDVFQSRFQYLKEQNLSARTIYQDIVEKVLQTDGNDRLVLKRLQDVDGEIALQAKRGQRPFGVINIGDVGTFLNLVEEHAPEIAQEEEHFRGSLFRQIKRDDSPIHLLIGSKKFIEGWSSWRVSNMGLMNMGRKKGPQVIQLFGRGVRLKGKQKTLKRSSRMDGDRHPENIELLETLNIFGLKADYMEDFKDHLEREGIETEFKELDPLPIEVNQDFMEKDLKFPRPDLEDGVTFNEYTELEVDERYAPTINLVPKTEVMESRDGGGGGLEPAADFKEEIPDALIELLDWKEIWGELQKFKREQHYTNISFSLPTLKNILKEHQYTLYCHRSEIAPDQFQDLNKLTFIAQLILKSYIERFYKKKREEWESQYLKYRSLDEEDGNVNFESYQIKVPRNREQLIEELESLVEEGERIYKEDVDNFNIHFDRHIYLPIFLANEDIEISPAGAVLENEGERKFVEELRTFCREQQEKDAWENREVFLLRNQGRGKGVGFFLEANNFYPDFMLWVLEDDKQYLSFVDPKGIRNLGHFGHPKIHFAQKIKDIQEQINEGHDDWEIVLNSFIVSWNSTHAEAKKILVDQPKEAYTRNHILFDEDDYIKTMFDLVLMERVISK